MDSGCLDVLKFDPKPILWTHKLFFCILTLNPLLLQNENLGMVPKADTDTSIPNTIRADAEVRIVCLICSGGRKVSRAQQV